MNSDMSAYFRFEDGAWPEICFHTLYAPSLDSQSVILDLGASSGGFSHRLAKLYGCACHTVEALPENFALIPESAHVRRYHFAMGGTDGPVTLHSVAGDFASGALELAPGQQAAQSLTVPGASLAGLLDQLGLTQIDLLKVDIEGAEYALFDNAPDDTLRRCAQITVEFHDFMDPRQTPDVLRIVRRMEGLGYWTIKFSGRHHGDVLFLDPKRTGISARAYIYARYGLRYKRGVARILSRVLGR